jgi:hypothetical protein
MKRLLITIEWTLLAIAAAVVLFAIATYGGS